MRLRLAVLTIAVTSLIVISFLVPLGILVRRQAEDRALARAETDARSVATALAVAASFSPAPLDGPAVEGVLGAFGFPAGIGVFLADGTVVGVGDPQDPAVDTARAGLAFTARSSGATAVLVPVLTSGSPLVVRAEVDLDALRPGVRTSWAILGILGGLLTLIAVVAADRLGRSMVGPVRGLHRATTALAAGQLDVRVEPSGPPEIVQVGQAFNDLAERLGELLQYEREAAADISHGLRTPLAALRLQVEGLTAAGDRASLLDDVRAVEEAIDAVILETRRRGDDGPRRGDLAALVRDRAEFWAVLTAEQGRGFEVEIPGGAVEVHASAREIVRVIDTLLENVFAHTPAGAAIGLAVSATPPTIRIDDGGPGFATTAVRRGESRGPSTGLGLDIVRRIAEGSGGSLTLGPSPLGGAQVVVRFGPATR